MEISSVELQKKINAGEKLMIEFHGVWCGPCKLMKPIFEKIAKENTSDVQMYTMDIDENREVAISLGIRSIPTVKMFNAGQVVETKIGLLSENQINDLVTELING
jgi:thioredoxin 1